MFRRKSLVGTLIAVGFALGCNKDDVPAGTAADVIVKVFVDADGSGDFSASDVAIPGSVTLTGADGTTVQATLDASGTASFTGVLPGSYTATVADTPPGGAILATAPAPVIVVPFQGGEVAAQFRYVFNPGTIQGVLYRDNNANGVFDAGTDTPAPGMTVNLFAGTDATQLPVAVTTTTAAGQFIFTGIRPGSYTVEIKPIPTIQLVGGDTISVVVAAATTTQAAKQFTGNLLVPISQVRTTAVGSVVAFEGTATAAAGLVGSNQLYVQDANAGVLVFGAPTAGIVAGDVVRVIGAIGMFSGEIEVLAPAGGALSVTKLSTGAAPAPKVITVAQLLSSQFLGQLISVAGVKVRSVVTTGATSYNVNFQGATLADTFQVRIGNTNNVPIPSTFWEVNRTYTLTGLDGIFNGLHQVKPRSSADVVVGSLPIFTIAAAKQVVNDTVTVEGIVTATRGTFRVDNAYVQDATSGVQIFNLPLSLTLALGDSVRVHGKMTTFSGENEIVNNIAITDSIKVTKLGTRPPLAPKVITGAQFLSRAFEGQLVTVQSVTIVTVGNASGSGTYTVTGTAPDGSAMTIFMSAPTGAVPPPGATYTVGSRYHLTGIAVPFGTPSVEELKPRGAADVVVAP
jgi:DNA/RNA endonuclease YhcR with UshA esterase domain